MSEIHGRQSFASGAGLPWCDAKIGFEVSHAERVWERFFVGPPSAAKRSFWADRLPAGWVPVELDGAGGTWRIFFRVSILPTEAAGAAVRALLAQMDSR